jgi:hypothetical protein
VALGRPDDLVPKVAGAYEAHRNCWARSWV